MDDNSGDGSYVFSNAGEASMGFSYGIGFIIFVFMVFVAYVIYKYMRMTNSSPHHDNNININTNYNNLQIMTMTRGVDDDVLMTLPAFIYSDDMMQNKGINIDDNSGCSICLADYKEKDVIRLLPECGHLFHIKCVDAWLKVHPNCPVCRKLVTAGAGHTLLNGDRINPVQFM